jgi:hypothetical protein
LLSPLPLISIVPHARLINVIIDINSNQWQ